MKTTTNDTTNETEVAAPETSDALQQASGLQPPPEPDADDPEADSLVQEINRAYGPRIDPVVVGNMLVRTKKILGHGRWMRVMGSGQILVPETQVRTYMRLARHKFLSKMGSTTNLPQSLDALKCLARLKPHELEDLIQSGKLTASTTVVGAEALVRGLRPRKEKVEHVTTRLDRLLNKVRSEADTWPPESRAMLGGQLSNLAKTILNGNYYRSRV